MQRGEVSVDIVFGWRNQRELRRRVKAFAAEHGWEVEVLAGIPLDVFAWDPKTETKTYLGACGINGEFITGSYSQGIAFDKEGNMSMHILYGEISEKQKKHWKIPEDFFYEDIKHQEHFLRHPNHIEGTYYSVFYVKNATSIR